MHLEAHATQSFDSAVFFGQVLDLDDGDAHGSPPIYNISRNSARKLRRSGRAYSHRIPLAKLLCMSEKRRLELAARLGGEPGGARRVESARRVHPLLRSDS